MNTLTKMEREILINNIRQLRKVVFPNRGGIKRLAEAIGVTPQLASQWLRGERVPSSTHLNSLAKVFQVKTRNLCEKQYDPIVPEASSDLPENAAGQIAAIDAMILILRYSKLALIGTVDATRHLKGMRIINDMLRTEVLDQ